MSRTEAPRAWGTSGNPPCRPGFDMSALKEALAQVAAKKAVKQREVTKEQPRPYYDYIEKSKELFQVLRDGGIWVDFEEHPTMIHTWYSIEGVQSSTPLEELESTRAVLDQYFSELEKIFNGQVLTWDENDAICHGYFSPHNVSKLRDILNIPKKPKLLVINKF